MDYLWQVLVYLIAGIITFSRAAGKRTISVLKYAELFSADNLITLFGKSRIAAMRLLFTKS
jgi:hypothetical protein